MLDTHATSQAISGQVRSELMRRRGARGEREMGRSRGDRERAVANGDLIVAFEEFQEQTISSPSLTSQNTPLFCFL